MEMMSINQHLVHKNAQMKSGVPIGMLIQDTLHVFVSDTIE